MFACSQTGSDCRDLLLSIACSFPAAAATALAPFHAVLHALAQTDSTLSALVHLVETATATVTVNNNEEHDTDAQLQLELQRINNARLLFHTDRR